MFRDTDWDALEEALRECAPQVTDSECAYLKDAFARTERMWSENFARVSRVRLVMLSEAPLFGAEASYIYNPLTRPTVFFRISDAEAILDPEFPRDRSDKQLPLPELAQAGFVILDVFPFALNELDTPSITYRCKSGRPCRKLSDKNYQHLFESTAPLYFDRKRDLILERGTPVFVFRYSAIQKRLGDLVDVELAKRGIGRTPSIASENMWLDPEKLKRAWQTMA
jgi:hypothetical protein